MKQVTLDRAAEDQSEQCGRQEGNHEIERETLRGRLRCDSGEHAEKAGPVFPAHGEHCARLNDDIENLRLVVVQTEQAACEDEVTGAGDGQKFGQALDNAHDEGLQR
jgi:hypothetical protein